MAKGLNRYVSNNFFPCNYINFLKRVIDYSNQLTNGIDVFLGFH